MDIKFEITVGEPHTLGDTVYWRNERFVTQRVSYLYNKEWAIEETVNLFRKRLKEILIEKSSTSENT